MPEGRQSPPPSMQSGKQLKDPPASGQGIDEVGDKEQVLKQQLENLESNPSWPRDEDVKRKFEKTVTPPTGLDGK